MSAYDKIAFLDRDGTLNFDPGYLSRPDDLRLMPKVAESLLQLKHAGFLLVVVSNQSGLARGLIQPEELQAIHAQMNVILRREAGAEIDEFVICPHHPDEGCACRKPSPALLLQTAQKRSIAMERTVMIGDKLSDIGSGRRAGCRYTIQVLTGAGAQERVNGVAPAEDAHFVAEDLFQAVHWLLAKPI